MPTLSVEPVPSNVTIVFWSTVWFGPAFAIGGDVSPGPGPGFASLASVRGIAPTSRAADGTENEMIRKTRSARQTPFRVPLTESLPAAPATRGLRLHIDIG